MVGLLVGCIGGAGTLRTQGMVLPQLVGWAQEEKLQSKWLPCIGKGGGGASGKSQEITVGKAKKKENPEERRWRRGGTLVGDIVRSPRLETGSFSGSKGKTAE